MTSKWTTSAPALSTASTSSPRRAKSADRMDGAIKKSDMAENPAVKGGNYAQLPPTRQWWTRPGTSLDHLDTGLEDHRTIQAGGDQAVLLRLGEQGPGPLLNGDVADLQPGVDAEAGKLQLAVDLVQLADGGAGQ